MLFNICLPFLTFTSIRAVLVFVTLVTPGPNKVLCHGRNLMDAYHLNEWIWKVEFHCKSRFVTLDNNARHQAMPDILSEQWNSGIDEECSELRDVEVTVNWEDFLAADHKRAWAPSFLLHSSSSRFKSTHNSAQILRMFLWARISTWVSTTTVALSLSSIRCCGVLAGICWSLIMVRAQFLFQQLFSSTFLGSYFWDGVNPSANLQWTASGWCSILQNYHPGKIHNAWAYPSILSISL